MAFDPPPTQAITAVGRRPSFSRICSFISMTDAAMKIAHHGRIGMRAERAAQQIMSCPDVGDPVAHGLADRVLQRLRAGGNAAHFRAEQPHAQDVQLLPLHVHVAHVDHALHAEQRADRRGGHAVLAGAGFGNDALLAHAPGQQALAERVVDLVRAGMEQVFALEINLGAAQFFRQSLGKVERRGPAGKVLEQASQFGLKRSVGLGKLVFVFQFEQRGHQRLRHIPSAIDAESPGARLRRSRWKNH